MTITSETNKNQYNCDGAQTIFPYTFLILSQSHLRVILTDSENNETVLTLITHYTVSGVGNPEGGNVTTVLTYDTGNILTIMRDVPLTQEIDYIENDIFPAASHEKGLDKLTMLSQQLSEELTRSLKLAPSSVLEDLVVPEGALSVIGWNADATALRLYAVDTPGFDLDYVPDGALYGRVALGALEDAHVLLIAALGDLDDIIDGTQHGKIKLTDISDGHIRLGECIGDFDDINNGTDYGKILLTDITAGHILLASVVGDLDDIEDGIGYGKISITDISAGHIVLATCEGDLDDIVNGITYGKIATTDISAGHILLATVVGDLDDIDDGTGVGAYGKILLTDIQSGHIKLTECIGTLDSIADGTGYKKVLAADFTAEHLSLSAIIQDTTHRVVTDTEKGIWGGKPDDMDEIGQGATYWKLALTEIQAGHIKLSTAYGNLDDIANGTYGKVLSTAISAGKIVLTSAGVTGELPTSLSIAKCTDPLADQTSAHNQNLGWLIGSSGNLTISAGGKLILNTADALEIQAAGNIKVLAGGDIEMSPNDANPALIKWSTIFNIGAAATETRGLCIWPTVNEYGYFYIGHDPINNDLSKFNNIGFEAKNKIRSRLYHDANNFAYIDINSPLSMDFQLKDTGVLNQISWVIGALHPTNEAISLGAEGSRWNGMFSTQVDAAMNLVGGHPGDFFNDGNNLNRYGVKIRCGDDNGSQCRILRCFDGGDTYHGYLGINTQTVQINQASDRRFKQNIVDTKLDALSIINALRIRDFEFKKSPGVVQTNIIAQEAQPIFPDAITEADGRLYLASARYIPILIKAIQQQQAEIDKLKSLNGGR